MKQETINLKFMNGHQIWIRKGHPRDVGPIDPVLFPFPSHGYKYFGIYFKKINKEDNNVRN